MSARSITMFVGAAALAFGLIWGFSSISRDGYSCGSAFHPKDLGYLTFLNPISEDSGQGEFDPAADVAGGDCSSALSDRKPVAFSATGIGATLLLFGGLAGPYTRAMGRPAAASRDAEQDEASSST